MAPPTKVARLVDRAEWYAMQDERLATLSQEDRRRRLAAALFRRLRLVS